MGKGLGFGIGAFVAGGIIGAAIALLYAPRTGEETRAIVADKVDDLLGQGHTVYTQGRTVIKDGFASAQPIISRKSDELREKIESARSVIAGQVAKNAAAARDVIQNKVPIAGEKISQTADVVKGQIDAAATKMKETAADLATQDADAIQAASQAVEQAVEQAPAQIPATQ